MSIPRALRPHAVESHLVSLQSHLMSIPRALRPHAVESHLMSIPQRAETHSPRRSTQFGAAALSLVPQHVRFSSQLGFLGLNPGLPA